MNKILALTVLGSALCLLQEKVHGQLSIECYSDGDCFQISSFSNANSTDLIREICCQNFQVNSFKVEGGEACMQCNPEDRPETTTATTNSEMSTTEVSTTTEALMTTTRQAEVVTSTREQSGLEQQDTTEDVTTSAGALGGMVYNEGSYFITVLFIGVMAFILGH